MNARRIVVPDTSARDDAVWLAIKILGPDARNDDVAYLAGLGSSRIHGDINRLTQGGYLTSHGHAQTRRRELIKSRRVDPGVAADVHARAKLIRAAAPPPGKPRKCLCCPRTFESEGRHNWVCQRCKQKESWSTGG